MSSLWCCLLGRKPNRTTLLRLDSEDQNYVQNTAPMCAKLEEIDPLVNHHFRAGEDFRILAEKPGGEGLFHDAIEQYRKSIDLMPTGRALSQLAYCLQETGQIHEALECYEKLVVICPEDQEAWYSKGFVEDEIGSLELGDTDRPSPVSLRYFNCAVRSFEAALNLKRDDKECLVMLGNVHMSLRNFKHSIFYYHRALEIENSCQMTLYNIAHVHHSMARDHEITDPKYVLPNMLKAELYFKEAIRLNHHYFDAHFNLGICYQDMALEYFTQQNVMKHDECLRNALESYKTVVIYGDGETKQDAIEAIQQIEKELGLNLRT